MSAGDQKLSVSHVPLLLCLCLCYFPCGKNAKLSGNETDRLSLLAIKGQITQDPMQVTKSWNESLHFCQWPGVSCSHRHQRVTVLNLNSQGLAGSISPSIGNLSFLEILDLSNNSFQGVVPPEISHLFRLQQLVLASNLLRGRILGNLSSCINLKILELSKNSFTGHIPTDLGSLSHLVEFYIADNKLTGAFPDSLGNISSLKALSVNSNELRGTIPETIGQLKSLNFLHVGVNLLSGLIPSSIYNLSHLTVLSMQRNQLEGTLPHNLGITLPNIQLVLLHVNKLHGLIPVSLSNASNLELVDIGSNKFSGGVPTDLGSLRKLSRLSVDNNILGKGQPNDLGFITSLTNCTHLQILDLSYNNLGGQIPKTLSNLSTQLEAFYVAANPISGNIPTGIGNLIGLKSLAMYYNQLTGPIPESISKLHKLQDVGFGKNNLSGEIPSSIGNLSLLNHLWLEQNNLQGTIPSTLGNCQSLVMLHLYGNALSGNIPREILSLFSLSKSLNLAQNQLTGPLPMEVGNLKNLVELNVSHNKLSGKIPSAIGSCVSLDRLYMDHNSFTGELPKSLNSLKSIEEIDVSQNNLSGVIPKEFATFPFLRKLNLSFNGFQGLVPVGRVFSNASAVSLAGNGKLCGGIPELQLPLCPSENLGGQKQTPVIKLIISLICGVLGVGLVLFAILFCWFKRPRMPSLPKISSHSQDSFMMISFNDLLKATNRFSSSNLIGIGSFGSVYKGILEQDQKVVAVKVLNLQRRGASRSFLAECKALRNIKHRNLVKIVTACSSIDFQGNEFKALVYEFMPNRSLEAWLLLVETGNIVLEDPKCLSLSQRLNIVIDVAAALDYLHNSCETPIIHCDIKPSNVLLDDDMTAHLSDFGLARVLTQCSFEFLSDQTSSVGMQGTIGYAAPEYGMGSMATTEGDVYSFGILLLEVFTGKRPTDDMFRDGLNLHMFVKMSLPDKLEEIVDHTLLQQAAGPAPNHINIDIDMQDCLISILSIGVACSKELARHRMAIHDALNQLLKLKNTYLS